ncbi:hypothetical protein [Aquimarina sp. 2201CG5-10]|uniref:hypothetical protein n=1 Tax=Aquimarina callyspongiae TaxID=3098150 RepID=UPI002AB52192|nr:hypothetical protein [Aquimarina sp. 2201CG5-10]MDY8136496.1 hypothetical protein [Aquimarina sp. 2201CG5-10]
MFTTIISSKRYWIWVFRLGIGFMIIFSIVEHFMQYGGLAYDTFIEEKINNGRWIRYVISRIAGGLIYGIILAYYFEIKKRKSNR